jgi:DNA-binding helix-hairpin-helix protein with protein kinase domain
VRTFHDLQGKEVGLGRCLGRGGEGAVYSVPMRPRFVAKLYARTPDEQTAHKLGAMVQLGTEALASFAAWPKDLLSADRNGSVVGFLMPRIDEHREIHALYGPTDRKTAFPDATWAFLVRAARNVAAAFDTVHQHGHVVGDVNQGNVVVSRKATVRLIDCDSFQITHLGQTYPCRVGVPLFTPPELQGRKLEGVLRTPDHDRFGLAVLVFHLLFMGRHPFAGRHPERAIPVEAAIREGLFAFGWEAARQGWRPPPFSLRLADVPSSIASLFERAFGREAAAGGPRPTAAEWVAELEQLEARNVTCGDDPRHVHAKVNGHCPWCRIDREGGPSFFFLPPGAAPDAFDLGATWRAIEAVRPPGPAPLPPPPVVKGLVGCPLPPGVRFGFLRRWLLSTASQSPDGILAAVQVPLMIVAIGCFVHLLWAPNATFTFVASVWGVIGILALGLFLGIVTRSGDWVAEWRQRRDAVAAGEEELRRLEARWQEECGEGGFADRRVEIEAAKVALEGLPAVEASEWEELTRRFREARLQRHLKSFALEYARIPGLGPIGLANLAARRVTTAADITPEALMAIPGIDLDVVKGLLLFKDVAARSFAFDPATGIPGKDRKALEDSQFTRREELTKTVQTGAVELADMRRRTLARREALARELDHLHRRLDQLRADAAVV